MATYPRIVSIKIKRGVSGAYFATSPDLEGFMAVSPDRDELEQKLIPQYLADLYEAAGQPQGRAVLARRTRFRNSAR